MEKQINAWPVY